MESASEHDAPLVTAADAADLVDAEPVAESAGEAALSRYDYASAAAAYEQALGSSPGDPSLLAGLARALALMGHCEEAREVLRRRTDGESR
jgi:Flp pilus assembly protein TadD